MKSNEEKLRNQILWLKRDRRRLRKAAEKAADMLYSHDDPNAYDVMFDLIEAAKGFNFYQKMTRKEKKVYNRKTHIRKKISGWYRDYYNDYKLGFKRRDNE